MQTLTFDRFRNNNMGSKLTSGTSRPMLIYVTQSRFDSRSLFPQTGLINYGLSIESNILWKWIKNEDSKSYGRLMESHLNAVTLRVKTLARASEDIPKRWKQLSSFDWIFSPKLQVYRFCAFKVHLYIIFWMLIQKYWSWEKNSLPPPSSFTSPANNCHSSSLHLTVNRRGNCDKETYLHTIQLNTSKSYPCTCRGCLGSY